MISLIIADDHTIFRQGLRQLLETNSELTVVGEASTGQEAIAMARIHRPDVLLLDIRMPDLTGVEATRVITRENPAARVLILTMYPQDHMIVAAIRAGAKGYLLKSCDEQTLFNAIEAIYRGDGWLDSAIASTVLSRLAQSELYASPVLTEQEMETLRYVAQGADNQTIAEAMNISPGTVANRLRTVYEKLAVKNRTEAALYALRKGWVSLDEE